MSDDEHMSTTDEKSKTPTATHIDAATTLQLQPFWSSNPRIWFQLADIQFDAAKVSQFNRYTKTLASLPHDICGRIPDIIADPPTVNYYQVLRDRLIERLAPSDERQLERIMAGEDLGDRKPSEIPVKIQTLAGKNFSTSVIRSLWTRKMPPLIKLALVAQDINTNITESAKMADKMHDILPSTNVHETEIKPSHSSMKSNLNTYRSNRDGNRRSPGTSVEHRLDRIEARLDKIFSARRSRSRERRSPSRSRSSTYSRSRERSQSRGPKNIICWFHERFGKLARRCRQPCTFGQSTSAAAMEIDQSKNV